MRANFKSSSLQQKNNYRLHGKSPYSVIVIHGGPGSWGEMAPVASYIAQFRGCVETFQTQPTLKGQLVELFEIVNKIAKTPVILLGFSWGAWLAYLFAAESAYSSLVSRLILIGTGPLEEKYFFKLQDTRRSRMNITQRQFYSKFGEIIRNASSKSERERLIVRLDNICESSDHFDAMSENELQNLGYSFHEVDFPIDRASFFTEALNTVQNFRKTGKLLELGKSIHCPINIIHGDYDPHPLVGVVEPLKRIHRDITVSVIPNCGHKPWIEKTAYNTFFELLSKIFSNK